MKITDKINVVTLCDQIRGLRAMQKRSASKRIRDLLEGVTDLLEELLQEADGTTPTLSVTLNKETKTYAQEENSQTRAGR